MQKLKAFIFLLLICFLFVLNSNSQEISADDVKIQYTGRIDFSNPKKVTFSFPGISIKAKFFGTGIKALIHDNGTGEEQKSNYFKVLLDDSVLIEQLKLDAGENLYELAKNLELKEHVIELIKITEGYSGKCSFKGFTIEGGKQELLDLPLRSNKKIEFIGDSWTCGFGNVNYYPTGKESMAVSKYVAKNEDSYYAWGPLTARAIGAEFQLTAISGRGLYRNNSGTFHGTLPYNYDLIFEDDFTVKYQHDFKPDIIVIHLGTNDMALEKSNPTNQLNDSLFEITYQNFISKLLIIHPCAHIIVCYGNSKTDFWPSWTKQLTRLRTIANNLEKSFNYKQVSSLELPFTGNECGYGDAWHPSKCSHQIMSTTLIAKINNLNINWQSAEDCQISEK